MESTNLDQDAVSLARLCKAPCTIIYFNRGVIKTAWESWIETIGRCAWLGVVI